MQSKMLITCNFNEGTRGETRIVRDIKQLRVLPLDEGGFCVNEESGMGDRRRSGLEKGGVLPVPKKDTGMRKVGREAAQDKRRRSAFWASANLLCRPRFSFAHPDKNRQYFSARAHSSPAAWATRFRNASEFRTSSHPHLRSFSRNLMTS